MLMQSPVFASNSNVGTSGAQFLKIGAGARSTALGDAFVGVADDANAVSYNPSGLGFLEKTEFAALHMQYFQGIDYDFGAYVQPIKNGAFALSAFTLKTDALTRRGLDESDLGTFTNQDAAYAVSYGHRVGETFAVGGTARFIREQIDSASAQTWSADLGLLKHLSDRPLSLGLAVRHMGPAIKFNEEGDPLPLTVDAGAGIDIARNRLKLAADVRDVRDIGVKFGVGAEWHEALRENFRYAARLGYNSANTDGNGGSGAAIGAGLGYKLFDLDFAWIPFGDLGNTFRYSAHLKF